MIKFYCSNCGTKIEAEPEYAGVAACCPSCSHDLVIPGQPEHPPKAQPQETGTASMGTESQAEQARASKGLRALVYFYSILKRLKWRESMKFVAPLFVVVLALCWFENRRKKSRAADGGVQYAVAKSYVAVPLRQSSDSSDDDLLEAGFTKQQIRKLKDTAASTGNSWIEIKRLLLKSIYPEEFREVERERRLDVIRDMEHDRIR
jgi:hypothetical protein